MFRGTLAKAANVAVLGAAGSIGQPLSLLLKTSPLVDELRLYDVSPWMHGIAHDLSHISTKALVTCCCETDNNLEKALDGANIVVIAAGLSHCRPNKSRATVDELFKANAVTVAHLTSTCAEVCPQAMIVLVSNPVNLLVPIAAEVLMQSGSFDPRKLFGLTTLNNIRAKTFLAEALQLPDPAALNHVPVVGGNSGNTRVPLFSQATYASSSSCASSSASSVATKTAATPAPCSSSTTNSNTSNAPCGAENGSVPAAEGRCVELSDEAQQALMSRVQQADQEVIAAKDGLACATLGAAYAAARFTFSLIKALRSSPPRRSVTPGSETTEFCSPQYDYHRNKRSNGSCLYNSGSVDNKVVECTFVASDLIGPQVPFFASNVVLGKDGVEEIPPLGDMTPLEEKYLDETVARLRRENRTAVDFAKTSLVWNAPPVSHRLRRASCDY